MLAAIVCLTVFPSNSSASRLIRSVSFLASVIQGVAASRICFRSSLRWSMDVSMPSDLLLEFHSLSAAARSGLSRRRPEAMAAEKMEAAASLAVEASISSRPGRAVTTYHVGLSQYCSVIRALSGVTGRVMVNFS